MAKTVNARWTAGYPVEFPDGTRLEPGDTAEIPAFQAKDDERWEPVGGKPKSDKDGDS